MKTDLTTLGSFAQSQARKLGPKEKAKIKDALAAVGDKLAPKNNADYKVELASKASPAPTSAPSLPSLPSLPSMPSAPSAPSTPKIDVKDIAKEEIKEEVKEEATEKAKEVAKVEEKEGTVKKPAIIFIKGLDIFSSPLKSEGGYAGVGRIAENVKGSRIYGWNQQDEIIKEIKKVALNQPVILVGHSLGGDTAVEIANTLDSLEHNFRPVDLLITMDAVGFNNDIIPQNVRKHLNIFGESSFFLNDGPHVARRHEMTQVKNILSPLDHTDLDDDKSNQYEIVNLIQETLGKKTSIS